MKTILFSFFVTALFLAPVFAAETAINGTWSGNWTPKGGVPDAVTVELRQESGKFTGKFLTPAPMDFTKATYVAATGVVTFEAMDTKSGKTYKLQGKVKGTELTGTLTAGETEGEIRLIKWTFFGR
jgi:hypothetical protein